MVPSVSTTSVSAIHNDQTESKMNAEVKRAFSRVKPVCDIVMVRPTPESIATYTKHVGELKKEALQELQQYVLFPVITHLRSAPIVKKYELQCRLVDAMRIVLEKVTINCYEMCLNIETGLMNLIFDYNQTGMNVPEEVKHSVMKCLTVLMLNLTTQHRIMLLRSQVPLLAQAVFVSVHIAKLERLRPLRLAGLKSLMAHTCTHPSLTNSHCQIADKETERLALDMVAAILPGVLAALQDVATCSDNPGHAVIVTALQATHRILCLVMHNKNAPQRESLTTKDFVEMIQKKSEKTPTEVSNKEKQKVWAKNFPKLSDKWYTMAGEKLTVVTKSLMCLRPHEHYKVRKELAVYCARVLTECDKTMQPSLPMVIDVLICLSNSSSEYQEVSQYATAAIKKYITSSANEADVRRKMESLCDNFFAMLRCLPRVLNDVDPARKMSALDMVAGYITKLKLDTSKPQKLTSRLSQNNMQCLCNMLLEAAAVHTDLTLLTQMATRDVTQPPPTKSPWCKLRNLDTPELELKFQQICTTLGSVECAELIVDRLLELFLEQRKPETVYLMNWMAAAPTSSHHLVSRILSSYIQEDTWHLPLEVGSTEPQLTREDTLDVSVYNPRAWEKDSVPDLYEGATETRYTDIPYNSPRTKPPLKHNCCATLAEAQTNMTMSCLMTEGLGLMAKRLRKDFQPHLMKTLCLILETVGSKYEMLHLSGLKAINDVTLACNHTSVAELIRCNADYFTNQVTSRLKRAWNIQSALHILSVVMEYSDAGILEHMQAIVENVLVQSCDRHYDKHLYSYLQVFITFLECIQKWFPMHSLPNEDYTISDDSNLFRKVIDYFENKAEAERFLSDEIEDKRSVEEMFKEDLNLQDENCLDYDDTVSPEKPPLPLHLKIVKTIVKRCLNFISNRNRDETILALQVMNLGLVLFKHDEDSLLPLVHLIWTPLVSRFEGDDPVLLRRALELLVTMADVAKDFIRSRSVKEVLPNLYKFLLKSAQNSYLKDAGSAYRNSHSYNLQVASLQALPRLVTELKLEDEMIDNAMNCVDGYLSRKQPKPLQALAVQFFQSMLDYDHGAAWHHLRKFCSNDELLQPPDITDIELTQVIGTPYSAVDKDYEANVKSVFKLGEEKK